MEVVVEMVLLASWSATCNVIVGMLWKHFSIPALCQICVIYLTCGITYIIVNAYLLPISLRKTILSLNNGKLIYTCIFRVSKMKFGGCDFSEE